MSDFKLVSDVLWSGAATVAINAAANDSSDAIKLGDLDAEGFLSVQVIQTSTGGTGTTQLQVTSCATETGTYTVPRKKDGTEVNDIVAAHADGQQYYGFPPFPISSFIKIKASVSTANVTSLALRITVQ